MSEKDSLCRPMHGVDPWCVVAFIDTSFNTGNRQTLSYIDIFIQEVASQDAIHDVLPTKSSTASS